MKESQCEVDQEGDDNVDISERKHLMDEEILPLQELHSGGRDDSHGKQFIVI